MNKPLFYIVDVFARETYTGNQLAVFRHAGEMSDEDMQKIAKEMNYSETTFITSEKISDGGYDVRIFTPEKELPFAGHPTLGTAFVIQSEMLDRPTDLTVLNLKVGQIPVSRSKDAGIGEVLWMRQKEAEFGRTFEIDTLAKVLNLKSDDFDKGFPIQDVSTGVPAIITPLKNLDAVRRAHIDKEAYFRLIKDIPAKLIMIFAPEPYDKDSNVSVRCFADYFGVPEDPATGSGAGCLAGYLAHHRFFNTGLVDIRVDQGYEIGRPSLLLLRSEKNKNVIDVQVGGKVIMVAKGELV